MILGTDNIAQHILHAHLKPHKQPHRPKFLKEFAKPTQDKIVFRKFPTLLKKIKHAPHKPDKNALDK